MSTTLCFRHKDIGCDAEAGTPEGPMKHSAFCPEHQPPPPSLEIKGRKQGQCAACGEVFTTTRTFDSHQSIKDGKVVCKDPRRMFNAEGRRKLMLTTRGWAKNAELEGFNTFTRKERG